MAIPVYMYISVYIYKSIHEQNISERKGFMLINILLLQVADGLDQAEYIYIYIKRS